MDPAGTVSGAMGATEPVAADSAPASAGPSDPDRGPPPGQPSRRGTKAITVHFPEEVRRQIKAMAGEQGRDVSDIVAEGLNLLFAKYRKPEVAPRKSHK